MEAENMNQSRELTNVERKAIRKLVTKECANYDDHYKICLPLDCPCYMLNKWWTGSYCRYFQNAVLPIDPMLEASLLGNGNAPAAKTCPVCGRDYIPVTSQAYCSGSCRTAGQREADRQRKRNKRNNRG
jgi:predicted nucleic acid-binding Zn ribbon protein